MNDQCTYRFGCESTPEPGTQHCWRHQGRSEGEGRSLTGKAPAKRNRDDNAIGGEWGGTTVGERSRKGRKGARVTARNHVKEAVKP